MLDVVVDQGVVAILQLLAFEDQALFRARNSCLALDDCLDGVDGVVLIDIQCDGLVLADDLDEDLHVSLC